MVADTTRDVRMKTAPASDALPQVCEFEPGRFWAAADRCMDHFIMEADWERALGWSLAIGCLKRAYLARASNL